MPLDFMIILALLIAPSLFWINYEIILEWLDEYFIDFYRWCFFGRSAYYD